MNKLIGLLKVQLNARYGFSGMFNSVKTDKKKFYKGIGLAVIIFISLIELMGLYTFLMLQLFKAGEALLTPQIVLTMASVVAGVCVLFFGIFYILSTLFLAKDTELLASLPVSQGSVFTSKFLMVLIGEYPFAFFLMLPPVIIYGINTHRGIFYYLMSIVCILLLPLIPLVISTFLSLLLMNIVSRSRRRDLITTIGSIVLLVGFVVGQNYLMSRIPSDDAGFMLALIKNSSSFIEFVGRAFPPSVWVTHILASGGLEAFKNFLYLFLVSALAFAIVYFIASFIYQRGATAQLETQNKPSKANLTYNASSQIIAIFKNEWRTILRTPIYALNSLAVVLMAPLLMMIPMFGGNLANDPDIKFIIDLIEKADAQSELLLILSGIISFFALINPALSSTFSREGKNIWILKNIPASPETQVYGKLLAGYSISFLAILLTALMTMVSLKLQPLMILMIIILCSLAIIPESAMNIYVDLKRPKLTWSNPQEAIKQNFNVIIGMLIGFLMISVFGVIGYFINMLGISLYGVFGIMALILCIFAYPSIYIVEKSARKSYNKIEA